MEGPLNIVQICQRMQSKGNARFAAWLYTVHKSPASQTSLGARDWPPHTPVGRSLTGTLALTTALAARSSRARHRTLWVLVVRPPRAMKPSDDMTVSQMSSPAPGFVTSVYAAAHARAR